MANATGSVASLGVQWLTGGDYPDYQQFNAQEQQLFDIGFNQITALEDYFSTETLAHTLRAFKKDYNIAAEAAKNYFNQSFGGTLLSSGFNMQLIRAASILTGSGSSPVYDWTKSVSATGWASLFGTFSNPINLGTTNSALTLGNTYNNLTIMATHLMDTVPPLYDEIQIKIGNATYEVYPVRFQAIERVFVYRLPAPMFIKMNGTFAIQANFRRTGQSNPQLLGLQFAPTAYASQQ
jgi:hypothetical protein